MASIQSLKSLLALPSSWQPICSAPKDGSPIIIWDDAVMLAYWADKIYIAGKPLIIPGWHGFLVSGEFGLRDLPGPTCHMIACKPTHWMPLPPPPS